MLAPQTSQVGQFLELVQQGDESARGKVIAFAEDRLRTLAHRMLQTNPVRQWEETDDLLQQTLIRVHRRLDQMAIADARSFLNLAALEMRQALIDFARHYFGPLGMGTHQINGQDEIAGSRLRKIFASQSADPAQKLEQLESWIRLYREIDALPAEEREVVDLLWVHELSQIETSALLKVAAKTIGRRWRRARLKLAAVLREEHFAL